jgi:hypothetical protein
MSLNTRWKKSSRGAAKRVVDRRYSGPVGLLGGSPDESTDESKIRRVPALQPATLHRKARRIWAFIYDLFTHVPTSTRGLGELVGASMDDRIWIDVVDAGHFALLKFVF